MSPIQLSDATLAASTAFALNLFKALGILVVGWIVAGWVRRLVRGALARVPRIDVTLSLALASIARYAVLVFVALAALSALGIQTASLLAVIGAAGLAVGLSLQGTLSNIAAGIMLLFLRPFRVGDDIDAGGIEGKVQEVGLFTVELVTGDGVYLSVPNGTLWSRPIKNFSRLPNRQLSLTFNLADGHDAAAALAALRGLLDDPRVLPAPQPEVAVTGLGEAGTAEVTLRCWTRSGDLAALASDLRVRGRERLATAGLSSPPPQG